MLGPGGPPTSTMRLVLLVIASYVRRRGSVQCWPSIRALEAATCLSQRSIIDQIEAAVAQGWLSRQTGQVGDMRRRGSIYSLTMPTAERHSIQPLNVVPPLLTSEVEGSRKAFEVEGREKSRGWKSKGNGQGARQGETTSLESWAATAGVVREDGESEIDFRKRASHAYGIAKQRREEIA